MADGVPGYRDKLRSSNLRDEADEDSAIRAATAYRLSEEASSFEGARESSHGGRKGRRSSAAGSERRYSESVSRASSGGGRGSPTRDVDQMSDVASLAGELQTLGSQAARRKGDKERSTTAGSERRSQASLKARSLPAGGTLGRNARREDSVRSSRASDTLRAALVAKKKEIDVQLDIEQRKIELEAQLKAEEDRLVAEERAIAMEERRLRLWREKEAFSRKQAADKAQIALARRRADVTSTYQKALMDLECADEESERSNRSSVSSRARSRRTEDWVSAHKDRNPSPVSMEREEGGGGVTAALEVGDNDRTSSLGRGGSDRRVRAAASADQVDDMTTEGQADPGEVVDVPGHSLVPITGALRRGVAGSNSPAPSPGALRGGVSEPYSLVPVDGALRRGVRVSGTNSPVPITGALRGGVSAKISPVPNVGTLRGGDMDRWSEEREKDSGHLDHLRTETGGRSPGPRKSGVRDELVGMTEPNRGALPFVSWAETSTRLRASEEQAAGVHGSVPSDTAVAGSRDMSPLGGLGAVTLTLRAADGSETHMVPVTHTGGLDSSKPRGELEASMSSPVGLRGRSPQTVPKPSAVRSLKAPGGGSLEAEGVTKKEQGSGATSSSVAAEAPVSELQGRRECACCVDRQSCSVTGVSVKPSRDMARWPYLRGAQSECSPSKCVRGCGQPCGPSDPFVDRCTDLPFGTSASNLTLGAQQQQVPLTVTTTPVTPQVRPPAYEMERFGGDPTCYHLFVRNFIRMVHRACVDDAERLARLAHLCTGRARDIVRSYEQWADASEGYKLALIELEEQFGQKDDVVVAWRAKLFTGKERDPDSLCRQLKICYSALRQLGHVQEMSSEYHLAALVKRLPVELQREWVRVSADRARRREEVGLLQLVHLLEDAAARLKREKRLNDMGGDGNVDKGRGSASCHTCEGAKGRSEGRANGRAENGDRGGKCQCCGGAHNLESCPKFESLDSEERVTLARKGGLCFCCLKRGHRVRRCPDRNECRVDGCARIHHPLLHRSQE